MSEREVGKIRAWAGFLYELGTLRKIARAHRQLLLEDDLSDNIASHSFRVTAVGWFLARVEGADAGKVMLMCLFHDCVESRSGDQNWIHKRHVVVDEEEITGEQFAGLPFGDEVAVVLSEYRVRESLEARVAKDADLLDQILLLREYELRGNREAGKWLAGRAQYEMLSTDVGRRLAEELYRQAPSEWWDGLWSEKRRK